MLVLNQQHVQSAVQIVNKITSPRRSLSENKKLRTQTGVNYDNVKDIHRCNQLKIVILLPIGHTRVSVTPCYWNECTDGDAPISFFLST